MRDASDELELLIPDVSQTFYQCIACEIIAPVSSDWEMTVSQIRL